MSSIASPNDFRSLYRNVAACLSETVSELEGLTVDHDEGRREVGTIIGKLRDRQHAFGDELGLLDENAEWEKFTVAFFGETNAGKSTLIEALRILFEEESREQLLARNAADLERRRALLAEQVMIARESLRKAFATQVRELLGLRDDVAALTSIVQQESTMRIRRRLKRFALGGFAVGIIVGAALIASVPLLRHA